MAHGNESRRPSSTSSEAHARLLYNYLNKYNEAERNRKRPSFIFIALIVLFLSSIGGITLAIVLMAMAVEMEAVCLARDFILFAGIMSLLYICLHICGARRDYNREGPGPPQMYGQYLHASALLVARLSLVIWIGALIATAIMIGRDIHPEEVSRKVPFLNLMLCVGAIPSFLLISITIEKIPTPFATTTISSASFLTCRLSQFTDDLTADSSVSRQSSLQRKRSQARTVLTMPTEKVFRLETEKGDEKNTTTGPNQQEPPTNEKVATSTAVESRCDLPGGNVTSSSPTPAVPQMTDPALSQSVPQPTYCPGGWQTEWDHASQISDTSVSGPSYRESQDALKASSTRLPQPSTTPSNSATASIPTQQYRYSYRLSGSVAPSNLSTVRYASEPEVAVQQSIRVVRNPAYQPRSISMGTDEYKSLQKPAISRPDVALLRNTQRAQRTVQGPRRQPSNFSRPIQKPDTQSEIDGKTNEEAGVKIPGAFVEDEKM